MTAVTQWLASLHRLTTILIANISSNTTFGNGYMHASSSN